MMTAVLQRDCPAGRTNSQRSKTWNPQKDQSPMCLSLSQYLQQWPDCRQKLWALESKPIGLQCCHRLAVAVEKYLSSAQSN
jgi:hypothetical protein